MADVVDRRKLKKIAENHEKASLSYWDLVYLDRFLEGLNEGLSYRPLFEKPDFLQSLAEGGEVSFLLGARPQPSEYRVEFSHWDVNALAEILRGVNILLCCFFGALVCCAFGKPTTPRNILGRCERHRR